MWFSGGFFRCDFLGNFFRCDFLGYFSKLAHESNNKLRVWMDMKKKCFALSLKVWYKKKGWKVGLTNFAFVKSCCYSIRFWKAANKKTGVKNIKEKFQFWGKIKRNWNTKEGRRRGTQKQLSLSLFILVNNIVMCSSWDDESNVWSRAAICSLFADNLYVMMMMKKP